MKNNKAKIIIIGAGPSGSIAGALLQNQGFQVTILERQLFPRFSIGESLLPQCMEFIKQAGMLEAVVKAGVTIAMKSASLAAEILTRQFNHEHVDWQQDYAVPLQRGVNTFRVFVDAWYDGRFQDVIFHTKQQPEIKAMISSILAGYAWDENNPYVKNARSRLDILVELCR